MAARGIRNNNPGNIVKTKKKWPGEIDGDDPIFKTFINMVWGLRAIFALFRSYNIIHNLTTLPEIFNKYAPKDNKGTDPVKYANNISKWTGIPKNKKIWWTDKETMIKIIYNITKQENGGGVTLAQVKEAAALFYGNKRYSAPKEEEKKEEPKEEPKYTFTPNQNTGIEEEKKEEPKNIARIFQDPNIRMNIPLDEISIPYEPNGSDTLQQYDYKKTIGIESPLIIVKDIIIDKKDIKNMEISCEDFLPTISLKIKPQTNSLLYINPIIEGDVISVFLRPINDALRSIRCDFVITSVYTPNINAHTPDNSIPIKLYGILLVPGIKGKVKEELFSENTSKDALKHICKKIGLGFAYNDEENTNDKMTWITPTISTKEEFIKYITKKAWKNETDFFDSWIDLYYNLNFININTMLTSSPDNIDVTIGTLTKFLQSISPIDTSANNATAQLKIFTNNTLTKNSSFFIHKYTPVNYSSNIMNTFGSQVKNVEFVHHNFIYDSSINPNNSLTTSPTYTEGSLDDSIVNRGRTHYDPSTASKDATPHANYDVNETHARLQYNGVSYPKADGEEDTSTNAQTGNIHKNFSRTNIQNELNINELNKMYLIIETEGVCFQILRGEKVPVLIFSKDFTTELSQQKDGNPDGIIKFLSGFYIVDGFRICYSYSEDDSFSNYTTKITLKRREWPLPVSYAKDTK